jgi:hypothetical protein
MSELIDRDRLTETIVEDALQTYPLATAPATLLPAVMARIQAMKAIPPFRLDWFDYAISLFVAGMAWAIFLVWRYTPWPQLIQLPTAPQWQIFGPINLWIILLGGLVLLGGGILTAATIFDREQTSVIG